MAEPDLNTRVLDKLFHITQITAELRQLIADETAEEVPPIASVLEAIDDRVHRLAKQLSEVPIGTVRN